MTTPQSRVVVVLDCAYGLGTMRVPIGGMVPSGCRYHRGCLRVTDYVTEPIVPHDRTDCPACRSEDQSGLTYPVGHTHPRPEAAPDA